MYNKMYKKKYNKMFSYVKRVVFSDSGVKILKFIFKKIFVNSEPPYLIFDWKF